MNIKKLAARVSVGVLYFVAFPSVVLAKAPWEPVEGTSVGNLDELIRIGLNTAIIVAAVVAVGYLVYNGFRYMMSAGDTSKTEAAQKGIANALIGLVICLAAALVVNFVLSKLGTETKPVSEGIMMMFRVA